MWEAKVLTAAESETMAEMNWKHNVTPDWDDLKMSTQTQFQNLFKSWPI